MQLKAKLIQLLPIQTGTSENGDWKKQVIIVETDEQYPKKVCISILGNKINKDQLTIGNFLKINFDVESKEIKGIWYTFLIALKIEVTDLGTQKNTENDLNLTNMVFAKGVIPISTFTINSEEVRALVFTKDAEGMYLTKVNDYYIKCSVDIRFAIMTSATITVGVFSFESEKRKTIFFARFIGVD